jgi:hypothetical protein
VIHDALPVGVTLFVFQWQKHKQSRACTVRFLKKTFEKSKTSESFQELMFDSSIDSNAFCTQ